ncbi:hypothetical protein [Viscerimonas tarda]
MKENKIKQYNKKGFLLPDSARSMASYHAKIDSDNKMKLTIHDCNGSIRLWNDLNNSEEINEAVDKLNRLSLAAKDFANFIYNNYQMNEL